MRRKKKRKKKKKKSVETEVRSSQFFKSCLVKTSNGNKFWAEKDRIKGAGGAQEQLFELFDSTEATKKQQSGNKR